MFGGARATHRRALRSDLVGRLAEGERLRLGENARHEQVVVTAEPIEGLREGDQVARDELRP